MLESHWHLFFEVISQSFHFVAGNPYLASRSPPLTELQHPRRHRTSALGFRPAGLRIKRASRWHINPGAEILTPCVKFWFALANFAWHVPTSLPSLRNSAASDAVRSATLGHISQLWFSERFSFDNQTCLSLLQRYLKVLAACLGKKQRRNLPKFVCLFAFKSKACWLSAKAVFLDAKLEYALAASWSYSLEAVN